MSQAEPTMRGQPRWSPKLTNIRQVALLPALMAGLAQSKASARLGEDGAVQNTAASAFRPRRRRIRDSDVERDQAVAQGDGRRNIAPGLIGDATAARAKHRLIAQNPAAGDEQFGVSALRRVDKPTAATAGATGDILTNEAGLDEYDAIDIGGAGAGAERLRAIVVLEIAMLPSFWIPPPLIAALLPTTAPPSTSIAPPLLSPPPTFVAVLLITVTFLSVTPPLSFSSPPPLYAVLLTIALAESSRAPS